MSRKRICIVDDELVARESLRYLLEHSGGFTVCAESEGEPESWREIADQKPDAVIMEIALARADGLQWLGALRTAAPLTPILALSKECETLYGERAIKAGASGFISKQESTQQILKALGQILLHQNYVGPTLARRVVNRMCGVKSVPESPMAVLANRELEILRRIGRGERTAIVAAELKISEKTVDAYRSRIKKKLNITDGTEFKRLAIEWANNLPGRLPCRKA